MTDMPNFHASARLTIGARQFAFRDESGVFVRFWGLGGWLREQTEQGLRLWNGE